MLSAADHRSAGVFNLVFGIVLIPLGLLGGAVFLVDRYFLSLGIPTDLLWFGLFPAISLIMGPVLIYRSPRHYRRAASMERIARGGIPAWGRFEGYKSANWSESRKIKGTPFYSGTNSPVLYLHFTVFADGQPVHESVAEDHLYGRLETYMKSAWVPLLLDPEDRAMAAVQWDALSRLAANAP